MGCVLEVDVNGEEVFFVDKEILASFCSRLKKLFDKPLTGAASARPLKVVFHDFPGGAETFELVARFCYTGGGVQATPANACILRCAAQFMEMAETAPSLTKMAEKSLEEMPHWPWHHVVDALKQCQQFFPLADSSGVFDKVMSSLLSQMPIVGGDATPTSSSPESSAFRFSCDTKSSSISMKNSSSCRAWWFEDLVVLNPDMMERVVEALMAKGIEHAIVSRFLFYYLKCRIASSKPEEKKKMIEAAIGIAGSLDRNSVSCKGLFGILRISSPLKLSELCQERLVSMIGSKIDHATLDNLLVPAPAGTTGSLYDVGLVLRFLESFLNGSGGQDTVSRLKRVGALMDPYLAEVAPDPSLKPSKFAELATALPPAARDCHDALYRAIDIYFQVHAGLTDEEKMRICKGINYEKLSSECCKHLAKNANFPTRTAVQALASQHTMLKNLIHDTNELTSRPPTNKGKQCGNTDGGDGDDDEQQVILYAKRLDLSLENENLKALLEGMHWRVMELEKVCSRMKTQMTKMKKAKKHNPSVPRSLPRLCS